MALRTGWHADWTSSGQGGASMLRKTVLFGLLALLAAPGGSWAYEEYTPLRKLGRGFAEMATGFLELPGNMVAVGRDDGAAGAMTLGFAKGIGMIPVRELVGVYDVVTSPIPAPGHYDPVIEPEF